MSDHFCILAWSRADIPGSVFQSQRKIDLKCYTFSAEFCGRNALFLPVRGLHLETDSLFLDQRSQSRAHTTNCGLNICYYGFLICMMLRPLLLPTSYERLELICCFNLSSHLKHMLVKADFF